MYDLELEWTVEVGGGERVRSHLPEEAVEKNTHWLVVRHCISRRWAGNQSEALSPTKTNARRADEWNGEEVFFLARKDMSSTKSHLQSQIWADI